MVRIRHGYGGARIPPGRPRMGLQVPEKTSCGVAASVCASYCILIWYLLSLSRVRAFTARCAYLSVECCWYAPRNLDIWPNGGGKNNGYAAGILRTDNGTELRG